MRESVCRGASELAEPLQSLPHALASGTVQLENWRSREAAGETLRIQTFLEDGLRGSESPHQILIARSRTPQRIAASNSPRHR